MEYPVACSFSGRYHLQICLPRGSGLKAAGRHQSLTQKPGWGPSEGQPDAHTPNQPYARARQNPGSRVLEKHHQTQHTMRHRESCEGRSAWDSGAARGMTRLRCPPQRPGALGKSSLSA